MCSNHIHKYICTLYDSNIFNLKICTLNFELLVSVCEQIETNKMILSLVLV